MKKISVLIIVFIVLAGFLNICRAQESVTLRDQIGRRVRAPFDPARIVCLGPGALRLIVYLQAGSKVAGVEEMEKMNPGGRPYWIAHPELSRLPRCGPGGPSAIGKKPDMEAVISLKPDVIFATQMDKDLADEVQRVLRVPLVVLSYGELGVFDEAVYDALRIAGRVLNRERRAEDLIAYIKSLQADLNARTKDIPEASKPSVYVGGIGFKGAHGIESTEKRYIPLDWIHARNIAQQLNTGIGWHTFAGRETLLKLNPDVIFIDGGGLSLIAGDYRRKPEFYNALSAFSQRRVYTLLPFNYYTTNIETALADAYAIGKVLYKDRFQDIDLAAKADEIFTFMAGKPVYQTMSKDYGPLGQPVRFMDE